MHLGSSCVGEFTQLDTGTASKSGVSGTVRSSTGGLSEESHASKWAGERMSGMRSWMASMSAFAAVVTMVKVSMVAWFAGSRQASQSPAKAIGALSRRRMNDPSSRARVVLTSLENRAQGKYHALEQARVEPESRIKRFMEDT